MRFEKWQALGNDYVIVEADALPGEPTAALVRALCDRHRGIGADGVLVLAALDLPAIGPAIEHDAQVPHRTHVSWYAELAPGRIRARIFERGVGETASSGTGACGAAIAHVLRGGDSPVTVVLDGGELEVDVGEDLHVDLTGWAVPVYAGEATPELLASLGSAQ